MPFTRREFLLTVGAAAAAAAVDGGSSPSPEKQKRPWGTLLGGSKFQPEGGALQFALVIADLDTHKKRTVPFTFFAHGFAIDPLDPKRVMVFEKKGPGCCEVDLVAGKVTRPVPTGKDRSFYGHGAFSKDGQVVFATESMQDDKRGLISIRDAKTLQVLGEMQSYGAQPHDCQLIDDGKTIAITNGGREEGKGDPSVTFVDVKSQKLLEKVAFLTPRVNAGHLIVTAKRDLVVCSAPRDGLPTTSPGGFSMRVGMGKFETMAEPADVTSKMIGETLSIAVHEPSQVAAATNPDGNLVTFWSLTTRKLVKTMALPAVRGAALTRDNAYFCFGNGPSGGLSLVSTKSLEADPKWQTQSLGITGSHLFNWLDPS
jgi:hypothetical protein